VLARIGAVLLLLSSIAAAVATGVVIARTSQVDDFAAYERPLGSEPGELLKFEPFTRGMPDKSIAWRILYTTTGLHNDITVATALVIVPADKGSDEPLPVILWAHGTTGVEPQCAPTLVDDPLGSGAFDFATHPLAAGWAIVAPDYLGLGTTAPHPYLVGRPTAHSSLDAVRAARQLETVSLLDDTVVWGHSQGGGAALWIGIEAPSYAPDVPLLGVAAMSPASDLPKFVDHALATKAGPIFGGYTIWAYSNTYDDVTLDEYIRPGARFSQEKLVERCLSDPSMVADIMSVLVREPFTRIDVHEGPLLNRLTENVPASPMGVPLFVGQGEADPLVEPSVQAAYVENLCGQGQGIEYHTYAGLDHLGVVQEGSPMIDDLMNWTTSRFDGTPGATECSTTVHD
jgi:acetyl esterase/lipase